MKTMYMQPTFSGGEFDDKVQGRIDVEKYKTGLKSCENFYIHKHGSLSNRTGFLYLGNAKLSNSRCRLVPFVYSDDQAYVLEFGAGYIRFWNSDGSRVMNGSTIVEVQTNYTGADLWALRFVQSADTIFIACKNHPPAVLTRNTLTDWTLEDMPYKNGPFGMQNLDSDSTITPSGTEGTIQLTATKDIFKPSHVGSLWRLDQNMESGMVEVEWSLISNKAVVTDNVEIKPTPVQTYRGPNIDITVSTTSVDGWAGEVAIDISTDRGSTWSNRAKITHNSTDAEIYWSMTLRNFTGNIRARARALSVTEGTVSTTVTCHTKSKVGSWTEGNTPSDPLICGANNTWRLITHGTEWEGTLVIERSYDNGQTWMQLRSYMHRGAAANYNVYAQETEPCMLRLALSSLTKSKVTAQLSVDPFVNTGYVTITGYTDARHVTAVVDEKTPIRNIQPTDMWYEAAWSNAQGWPSAVCFYEDRLCFGGTQGDPRSVWMSKTADYYNFGTSSPTSEADDSIQITLTSRKMSRIHSFVTLRQSIMAFSEDGVNTISYSDASLTPSSVMQRAESYFGAKDIDPVTVGAQVVYVQEVGGSVRDIGYDYVQDAYTGDEVSLYASSFVNDSPPVDMAYQQEPDSIVWYVREDGMLLSMTYMREQKMIAWAHHTTQGEFESVCSIPYNGQSRLWAVVRREVNGQTVRYIERMANRLPSYEPEDQLYLDAAYVHDGTPVQEISAPHLAGCKVRVMADGNVFPDMTVGTDGTLDIGRPASKIAVGLGYNSRLETLNIEMEGLTRGVIQGHNVKVAEVILRLLHSRGGRVGQIDGYLDEWQRRQKTDFLGSPLALFTGDAQAFPDFEVSAGGRVIVVQDVPMPFTLLGIIMSVEVSDD